MTRTHGNSLRGKRFHSLQLEMSTIHHKFMKVALEMVG